MDRRNFLSLTMGIWGSRLWGQGRSRWDLSHEDARDLPEEGFREWVRF